MKSSPLDFNRSKSSRWPQLMLLGPSVSIRKLFNPKKTGKWPLSLGAYSLTAIDARHSPKKPWQSSFYFFTPKTPSFAALATRNLTTVLAGILIFCCDLGLKPVRAFLFCFTSLPKPGKTLHNLPAPNRSLLFRSPAYRRISIRTGENMFRNKIPETLTPGCLCNGMKTLISDHDYELHLGGIANPAATGPRERSVDGGGGRLCRLRVTLD
jgi:hypothetical protein